ncbi:MAG: hypothetical protein OEQ47_02240 [Acidimicrobiia bacterium]|nr:hypothetical protein [Acidimicrobiia bacterium]
MTGGVSVSLEAVIVAVTDDRPRILTVDSANGPMLPSGSLDVAGDRSLDLAMRRVIDERVGFEVEYLEQLYTFGDLDRSSPDAASGERALGVGYLVLTREAPTTGRWVDWYHLFPWEDLRARDADSEARAMIGAWAGDVPHRRQRVQIAFGMAETPWDGVRALDRYELLYEAHLVPEWFVDHDENTETTVAGEQMALDHRRVSATALSRLRGKLTYRPLVFDLMPETFTLSHLQRTVEALAGQSRHTQNFRRQVERGGLVEGTGRYATTGGRPAELFRFRRSVLTERPRVGILG